MNQNKQYKKPPLIEAVFELFFDTKKWNSTVPGLFYNEIKDNYPTISQAPRGLGIAIQDQRIQIGRSSQEITQYISKDKTSIIQLSDNMLSVNKLPKYEGWDEFKKSIHTAVSVLIRVIDDIAGFRMGLKALNKLDIEKHSLDNFKKTFNIYPNIPTAFPVKEMHGIRLNYEMPVQGDSEFLTLSLATLKKEAKYSAPVILQLSFTQVKGVKLEGLKEWLEKGHSLLHKLFEESITEETKKSFDHE